MKNINRVQLMGHLVADPDYKTTTTGKKLCSFVTATNNEWRDNDGKNQKTVDYHRVIAWDRLAERCHRELKKSHPVFLEGRLTNRSYEGKDGTRHYVTEVNLQNLSMIVWKEKEKEIETHELAEAVEDA
jgi:single-strand DNA-binding protein